MRILGVLAIVAGCSGSGSQESRCRAAVENIAVLTKQSSKSSIDNGVRECTTVGWSAESLDCLIKAKTVEDTAACPPTKPKPIVNSESADAKRAIATTLAKRLVFEAYPQWAARHADKICPASIEELRALTGLADLKDPWGNFYIMKCDGGVSIRSTGPDGQYETADDIVVK